MSAWRVAVGEVYRAGGRMPTAQMFSDGNAIRTARALGMLEAGNCGGGKHYATLTQRGRDLMEGRLVVVVPRQAGKRAGMRPTATWLAALPRSNEVRLTGAVHRAQNDGSCYW